jgi:hypothetical protein
MDTGEGNATRECCYGTAMMQSKCFGSSFVGITMTMS